MTARSGWLFAALLLGPSVLGAGPAGAAALIAVQGEPPEFRVTGAQALAGAANVDLQDILQVGVDAADLQPMAGSYRLEGGVLIFRPAFPLQPGVTYKAQYRHGGETAAASYTIPKVVLAPSAEVERVFPTRDVLPQNQLKMYVHFTASMSRGGAYQRIHIIDDSTGVEVRYPFLRLAEELWDNEQKRLTVLFDPGRIKRGLVSQEELGMAIQPDHQRVHPAPVEPGHRPEQPAQAEGEGGGEQAREERDPRAVEQPRELVAAEAVRAEQEEPRGLVDAEEAQPATPPAPRSATRKRTGKGRLRSSSVAAGLGSPPRRAGRRTAAGGTRPSASTKRSRRGRRVGQRAVLLGRARRARGTPREQGGERAPRPAPQRRRGQRAALTSPPRGCAGRRRAAARRPAGCRRPGTRVETSTGPSTR